MRQSTPCECLISSLANLPPIRRRYRLLRLDYILTQNKHYRAEFEAWSLRVASLSCSLPSPEENNVTQNANRLFPRTTRARRKLGACGAAAQLRRTPSRNLARNSVGPSSFPFRSSGGLSRPYTQIGRLVKYKQFVRRATRREFRIMVGWRVQLFRPN